MTNKVIAALTIAIITRQHIVWIGLRKIFEHGETRRFVVLPHRLIVSDALLPENRPDVFILDMETERDTIGVISQIRKATPKSKIMLLSGFEDKERTREAFEYGVEGVILKIQPPEVVLAAIDALYVPARHLGHVERDGTGVVKRSESLVTKADTDTHPSVWPDALTQREREVIGLVGQGLSNKDIAYQLSISDSTVRHHLTNIFDKVGVPNRQKLLLHAHQVRATPD